MRQRLVLAALVPVVIALGGVSTAQARPLEGEKPTNHGQCVSESSQSHSKGGRSATAKSKGSCTPVTPPPLPCTETEAGVDTVTRDSAANTVTVRGSGPESAGSNLACATSIEVTAGDTVTFDYSGVEGCSGGVPRVYVLIDGTYHNTHDAEDGGINADCLPGSVTYTIPVSGTIDEVAFIYDRKDFGSVTYSNTKIDGVALDI